MDKYQFGLLIYWMIAGVLNVILEITWDRKNKIDAFKIAGLGYSFIIGWMLIPLYMFRSLDKKYGG